MGDKLYYFYDETFFIETSNLATLRNLRKHLNVYGDRSHVCIFGGGGDIGVAKVMANMVRQSNAHVEAVYLSSAGVQYHLAMENLMPRDRVIHVHPFTSVNPWRGWMDHLLHYSLDGIPAIAARADPTGVVVRLHYLSQIVRLAYVDWPGSTAPERIWGATKVFDGWDNILKAIVADRTFREEVEKYCTVTLDHFQSAKDWLLGSRAAEALDGDSPAVRYELGSVQGELDDLRAEAVSRITGSDNTKDHKKRYEVRISK